jgi:hypothetical protein
MGAAMLEGLPLVGIGQGSLLALVVMLVLTDRLVWHKRLDALQKQVDTKDALIADLTEQNTMLLKSAIPTVNSVLGALHEAAGGPS